MKKSYLFLLSALVMLLASFQANAALTATVKWDNPGAVDIYVGGFGDQYKASIPEGATEYTAVLNQDWGSMYVAPATGYAINSLVADGNTLNPLTYGNYAGSYNVNLSTYDGKTVVVETEKIVYDGTMTINVINGREVLVASMLGTNREIKFKTGQQTIKYSTKYEPGIDIQAPKPAEDATFTPVITQNGIEMEWKAYYSWDTYICHKYQGNNKGFLFADGTDFTVQYSDQDDPAAAASVTVTLNYTNYGAQALKMVRNQTTNTTISERDYFEMSEGDVLRLVFDAHEYTVKVNGQTVAPDERDEYGVYEVTVNNNRTLNIDAVEREWGNTTVTIAISDLDGVVLRAGAYNGPVVDKSTLTSMGTVNYRYQDYNKATKSATMTLYSIPVSLKSPKVFVDEVPDYWFACAEYTLDGDITAGTVVTPDYILYIDSKPIVRDTRMIVYMATDGYNVTPDAITFRDRNRNVFELQNGYNEIMIDKDYSAPFSVVPIEVSEGTAFSVYTNMSPVSLDEDSQSYPVNIYNDYIAVHIFGGRPAPAEYNLEATFTPDAQDALVYVDRVRPVAGYLNTTTVFAGCEVSVTPNGHKYLLNGEAPEYTGTTHTFNCEGDCAIILGDVTDMKVTPANGAELESFTNFLISFPSATTATFNNDYRYDLMLCDAAQNFFGVTYFNIVEVNGAAVPTFRITPYQVPTKGGYYKFVIPEGAFTINGSLPSEVLETYFTIVSSVNTEDIVVNYAPETDMISLADFYGITILFGEDVFDYSMEPGENAGDIVVKLNGTELVMGEGYGIEQYENTLFISLMTEIDTNKPSTLYVNLPLGAFDVDGAESPAFEHTWTIVPAKEYQPTVCNSNGGAIQYLNHLAEIYVSFPGAETATIAIPTGATLIHSEYHYSGAAKISAVAPVSRASETPTFKLTFDPAPTEAGNYKLHVLPGTFLLDGYAASPEIEQTYGSVSGIEDIVVDLNANVTVIDIYGRVLLNNAPAAALRTLAPGIYIVNGEKYVKE